MYKICTSNVTCVSGEMVSGASGGEFAERNGLTFFVACGQITGEPGSLQRRLRVKD